MNANQVPQDVQAEVNRQVDGVSGNLLDRIVERLGGRATVAAVYGAPVERDGVTVIPVARVRMGFGAGSGRGKNTSSDEGGEGGEGSGEGGGGGMTVAPLGYIEIANGEVEFQRIRDASSLPPLAPLLVAAGFSVFLILIGLARLRRT